MLELRALGDHAMTSLKPGDEDGRVFVWPLGCELPACRHHFQPGRNLTAEGCICPAWFDGGGWHIISQNADCRSHLAEVARTFSPEEGTGR